MRLGRAVSDVARARTFLGFSRYSKRVCSSQVMPLFTFAAVYEKPSAWPVLRPKTLQIRQTCQPLTSHRAVTAQGDCVRTRAGWGRPCGARPRRECGTERNGS